MHRWQPLLSDDLAAAACAAVEDIAADLRDSAASSEALGGILKDGEFTLADGPVGPALFFAYLDAVEPDRGHGDLGMDLLERAIEATAANRVSAGLYSGFSGVAWAVEHLRGRLFEEQEGEDSGGEAASALLGLLRQTPWRRHYDLISGLVGFGVYALERSLRPGGEDCLRDVVARLAEGVEECPEGLAWRTSTELLSEMERARFPEGNFNAGVAHGVPGVIAFLAEASRAGCEVSSLLDGSVRWLLAQKLPPGSDSVFPYSTGPGAEPHASRLAWCYGDAGIAVALLGAARAAGRKDWEREALAIARHAAERSVESAGVQDAALCHGAAGVAHLFNRFAQATGEGLLADAARSWFGRALEMRRPGEGFGGFRAWVPDEKGAGAWTWGDVPGFLTGAAGIGLALLAALTPVEPSWDRLLLARLASA